MTELDVPQDVTDACEKIVFNTAGVKATCDGFEEAIAYAYEAGYKLALSDAKTEYAVFNDPEFWEPLYANREMPESLRNILDEPLHAGLSLAEAKRKRDFYNMERAELQTVEKYGMVIIMKRQVLETHWMTVTYEELDEVR